MDLNNKTTISIYVTVLYYMMTYDKKGFTLIEILITIIVISLFSALSLAGYSYFREQKILEDRTKQFVEVLELAKKMAVTGQIPPTYNSTQCPVNTGCECGPFTGAYKIHFYVGGTVYLMGGVGSNGDPDCTYIVSEYIPVTPENIVLSKVNNNSTGTNVRYGFKPFGFGVQSFSALPLDSQDGFSVTLKNLKTNQTKTVQVDRAGTISVQ